MNSRKGGGCAADAGAFSLSIDIFRPEETTAIVSSIVDRPLAFLSYFLHSFFLLVCLKFKLIKKIKRGPRIRSVRVCVCSSYIWEVCPTADSELVLILLRREKP